MSALTLVVPLLVAAANDCYLVTNKRIQVIPCNFDPVVIAKLLAEAEESKPTGPPDARPPQGGTPPVRVLARERPQSGGPNTSVQGREPQQPGASQAVPRGAEPPQLLATVAELRALEAALASGSTRDAEPVLARAAQAFAAANLPEGAASVNAAQQALARRDLYAARQAIASAIGAAATRR